MYNSCATCEKVGISCRGPKFVSMPANDLIALCKARKAYLGLSNQQIAERANMSKGTVDGLFAAAHADFRYGTIQPVLDVLFGGAISANPCPDIEADERAKYEETILQYQQKITDCEKKISFLKEQVRFKERQMEEKDKLLAERGVFIAERGSFMKRKDRIIAILALLLAVSLGTILVALLIDAINPNIGFFWR